MDRRRPLAPFLSLRPVFAALVGVTLVAAAGPSLSIKEAQWTMPDKRVLALTTQPKECLILPAGSANLSRILVGRAAFKTPLLLGGQAARAGLSCASCHRQGRGNPDFVFPGLSGPPGTADVTSSIMSSKRGDGVANPKPIPDLAMDPAKIARDPVSPDLRNFIRGLVVDEFDGAEPPAAVLDGLTAYVRAISPAACGTGASEPVTLRAGVGDVIDPTEAALRLWQADDEPSARLMIAAARAALGRIHERFGGPALERQRKQIMVLDAGLRAIQAGMERQSSGVYRKIIKWQNHFAKTVPALLAAESQSLYAADQLRGAFPLP